MTSGHTGSWFSTPVPVPDARARLFCIPYAGSGASCYHSWARPVSGHAVEMRAAQLPGRENRLREEPFRAMGPMVAALADGIEPFLDRPYGVFGHSMGALVAFELVRELRRRRQRLPSLVWVSGASAPQVPREDAPLHQLPDAEFVQQVSERYGGIPQQVLEHRELLELVLPTLRADITIIETYVFGEDTPLPCAISAYAGRDDEHVTTESLERWREVTSEAFVSEVFDGGHFYLQEHREGLLARVLPALTRMGGTTPLGGTAAC